MKKEQNKKFQPYPTHPIRMAEKTWQTLKKQKIKSGLSWNLFIVKLLENDGRQGIQKVVKGRKEKEENHKSKI